MVIPPQCRKCGRNLIQSDSSRYVYSCRCWIDDGYDDLIVNEEDIIWNDERVRLSFKTEKINHTKIVVSPPKPPSPSSNQDLGLYNSIASVIQTIKDVGESMARSDEPHLYIGISSDRVKKIRSAIRSELREELTESLTRKLTRSIREEEAAKKVSKVKSAPSATELRAARSYLEDAELHALAHASLLEQKRRVVAERKVKISGRIRSYWISALASYLIVTVTALLWVGGWAVVAGVLPWFAMIFALNQAAKITNSLGNEESKLTAAVSEANDQASDLRKKRMVHLATCRTPDQVQMLMDFDDNLDMVLDPSEVEAVKDQLRFGMESRGSTGLRISDFDARLSEVQAENEAAVEEAENDLKQAKRLRSMEDA